MLIFIIINYYNDNNDKNNDYKLISYNTIEIRHTIVFHVE